MDEKERWERNDKDHEDFADRIRAVEERLSKHDTQYAVINTKLSAILWGVGVIGTALIGVLVKIVFKA
ncbi:MAG: hypothetical protein IJT62_04340 [Oscillospiraceae bacterium]|nr:hypothetical protein [Oscillospiraceae bacterium]